MQRVLYDLTGLANFAEILEPLKNSYSFLIGTGEELASVDPNKGLDGKIILFSDEHFGEKSDVEIVNALSSLRDLGLQLIYIGVPRRSDFEQRLKEAGIFAYIVPELTEEGVIDFVGKVFDVLWTSPLEQHQEHDADVFVGEEQDEHKVMQVIEESLPSTKSLCVVVSGAPGAGSTFVGLNLASILALDVNYVEAGLRPCLTTWLGAEDEEQTATLAEPLTPSVRKENLAVFTQNPFGEEKVNLRQVAAAIETWEAPTVVDLHLQDYLASIDHQFANQTVHVLVTTADLHRCRYLEGVSADVVVVNQVPVQLPIDEEEFQAYWPDSKLIFVPHEPKQEIAVVQGQPVVKDSDAILSAMMQLIAAI